MLSAATFATAEALLARCRSAKRTLVTAESCTGGLLSAALTAVAGSSDVFERGFVTYSNGAKAELLGVPHALLNSQGAVSAEVAAAMAEGAIVHSRADLAVAITGIAGPGGGTPNKPVGLVFLATALRGGGTRVHRAQFSGDRAQVRAASVLEALAQLDARLD